jgi:hypothetical protein
MAAAINSFQTELRTTRQPHCEKSLFMEVRRFKLEILGLPSLQSFKE